MNAWILAAVLILGGEARPPAYVALNAEARGCVDARGLMATCGESDAPGMHECYAADNFGRCPGDPKCFRPTGEQTYCRWPVVKVGDRQRTGVWLDDDGLLKRR